MTNDILVVESKNGKVTHKYISKKSAKKHMSERHERLDRDARKKSTKKSTKKLVVMVKNNKPSHKYMTKKEMDKHFNERHKRYD